VPKRDRNVMLDISTQSGRFPDKCQEELTVALVGQPNVGKSVLMNLLTGAGAVVSNYPGTTVEITEGSFISRAGRIKVIDTPGTYSLHSDTEEQRVTQRVLLERNVDIIVNVLDARNLARNLYLSLQLFDLRIPMILVLNQMDMAEEAGICIDLDALAQILGVPVIAMVASKGKGLQKLQKTIVDIALGRRSDDCPRGKLMVFSEPVERVIKKLQKTLENTIPEEKGKHRLHPSRALAIHLMEHDTVDEDLFKRYPKLSLLVEKLQQDLGDKEFPCAGCFRGCTLCPAKDDSHPIFPTCIERTQKAREIAQRVITHKFQPKGINIRERLETYLDWPPTGIPLLLVLAYGSFKAVIAFMSIAETVVPWLFDPLINSITSLAELFPRGSVLEILVSAVPDGLLLPFTVVLPAMISIYFIMSLLEDTGLLPRVAVTMDRSMSFLGLPGQSIIPLLLGFGCRAPAILAARTLPGKRSRLSVSALLAIPVPCAASLGIITGVASTFGASLPVIYGSMLVVFLAMGLLLSKILGTDRDLVLEVPPLRFPVIRNIAAKTWMRFEGFFKHVLPILLLTSVGVRVLLDSGVLTILERLDPASTMLLGIRGQSLVAIAFTVIQRYMAPMVLLNLPLSAREATIAGAMVSLSLPCLPVSILIARDFGWRWLVVILGMGIAISLGTGFLLNLFLPAL